MHILALDQGTTSSRAIIFDGHGQPVASAQQEFNQHYPEPGWVEQNPAEIWESQLATAREALRRARLAAGDLACIGITNQRETVVCWERASGRPLHRAIVWQDRRTAEACSRLERAGHGALVRDRTGLVLDPYFSATKIRWLLDHVDGLRSRAAAGEICFGTVDSWILYRLTGGQRFATDVTNASRTLLFDIRRLEWDEDLCDLFGVPLAALPEVCPSAAALGEADPALLGARVPITGAAGDQQAALFGQACLRPGMAKNTYGTGSFVVMHSGDRAVQGEGVLTTLAWQLAGETAEYALEAPIFVTGAAVQWLRDGLGLIRTSAEIEDLAAAVADNGGVYFVPALAGLGAPHWDPYARGLVIGITRGTTRHHLARAALEAMAYQTRDGTEAMQAAAGVGLNVLRADGGAAVNDTLMQFQADILGVPVLRPRVTETTALGAAFLAGLGAGLLSRDDIEAGWVLERRFEPAMDAAHRARLYAGWRRAVERAAHWAEPDGEGEAI